jgi:hypothetical protein
VIVLGVLLLVLGLLLGPSILTTLGVLLIVIGVVLMAIGHGGPLNGRWY